MLRPTQLENNTVFGKYELQACTAPQYRSRASRSRSSVPVLPDGARGQIVAIVERDYAASDIPPAALVGQLLRELANANAHSRALARSVITAVASLIPSLVVSNAREAGVRVSDDDAKGIEPCSAPYNRPERVRHPRHLEHNGPNHP